VALQQNVSASEPYAERVVTWCSGTPPVSDSIRMLPVSSATATTTCSPHRSRKRLGEREGGREGGREGEHGHKDGNGTESPPVSYMLLLHR
jgi:hypothetical protein